MAEGIAEVLRRHWSFSTHTDHKPCADKCDGCGHVLHEWGTEGNTEDALAAHQAEVLAANGYGDVREARASALLDAADERYKDGLFVFGLATRQKLRARAVTERGGE
jgi:hypothetical protein